jgi:hypothetical protein
MIWIGLVWDMKSGKFRISNERVDRLVNVIEKTLLHVRKDKVLYRAKLNLSSSIAGAVKATSDFQLALNTMHVYNSLVLNLTKLPKTACIEMI